MSTVKIVITSTDVRVLDKVAGLISKRLDAANEHSGYFLSILPSKDGSSARQISISNPTEKTVASLVNLYVPDSVTVAVKTSK